MTLRTLEAADQPGDLQNLNQAEDNNINFVIHTIIVDGVYGPEEVDDETLLPRR